ncbi:TPA: helix-turn-helix domain-containing protein [Haemophilus influenzae]|uniref:helix-turn-helix domain-containing protein n=1 Tax=Haemophilus influenzae TaxID=727 RepID=UPI000E593083|nr:helix-turn-helix domain-containing protein [Haemophilus influenzae]
MEQTLTIRDVAKCLNLSETTVRKNKLKWGFFQMEGSRMWRVFKSDLDRNRNRKKAENLSDLYAKVGDTQEKQKCRSAKIKMACGKSILPHQAASEFDAVVKQLTKN